MIELTKDRLEEARFFLGQLRQHKAREARPNKPPPEHFRYYLNAFLNAARSVTLVLEKEEPEKYNERAEAEDALRALMRRMRNISVHEGRIETTIRSEEVPIIVAPSPYQVHALRAQALSLRKSGGPWTSSDVHYVQLNGTEQEVVAACQQYVDYLAKLVQDFIDKHHK
jgi:hypothetical protein